MKINCIQYINYWNIFIPRTSDKIIDLKYNYLIISKYANVFADCNIYHASTDMSREYYPNISTISNICQVYIVRNLNCILFPI